RLAEAADRLVDDLLSRQPRIDGVFIAEDAQAALLVPALQRRGVDTGPGGDLSVISCNDERPYLMGLNPCPPTIDIRVEAIGRRGADQLLWRIAQGSNADRMCTTVEPRLVLPESLPVR
ncbi:MAG: substrate-binding domain-containing protein, partial [Planctomycetota bacterium]